MNVHERILWYDPSIWVYFVFRMQCLRLWHSGRHFCSAASTKTTTVYARGSYSAGASDISKAHFNRLYKEVIDVDFDRCATFGVLDSIAGDFWQRPWLKSLFCGFQVLSSCVRPTEISCSCRWQHPSPVRRNFTYTMVQLARHLDLMPKCGPSPTTLPVHYCSEAFLNQLLLVKFLNKSSPSQFTLLQVTGNVTGQFHLFGCICEVNMLWPCLLPFQGYLHTYWCSHAP